MKPTEIKAREIYERFFPLSTSYSANRNNQHENAKQCALICVDKEIELVKFLIDESVNIHQSLSTPKKLCIDILNPKIKELLEVKNHIEKL